MSSHPRFNAIPEAVAMYVAGACRRWAIVDGHLVDLQQAAHPVVVSRPEYQEPKSDALPDLAPPEVPAAPPAVECCRACGRPMIGEVTP